MTAFRVLGVWPEAEGCAELINTPGSSVGGFVYDRIVRSWSAVGGDSTTSRLYSNGGAELAEPGG